MKYIKEFKHKIDNKLTSSTKGHKANYSLNSTNMYKTNLVNNFGYDFHKLDNLNHKFRNIERTIQELHFDSNILTYIRSKGEEHSQHIQAA